MNGFDKILIFPKVDKILVKNIKGKTLGKTFKAHAVIPSNVAETYLLGLITILTSIKHIKIVKKVLYFFI